MKLKKKFKLLNKIYLDENIPCRVFVPGFYLEGTKYYYIMHLDTEALTVTEKENLSTNYAIQVLYGERE